MGAHYRKEWFPWIPSKHKGNSNNESHNFVLQLNLIKCIIILCLKCYERQLRYLFSIGFSVSTYGRPSYGN